MKELATQAGEKETPNKFPKGPKTPDSCRKMRD
jgi:hypothetical protein